MKSQGPRMLLLAVGIVVGIMLITGCEEEEKLSATTKLDEAPDAKRSRLIAVENAQLKKQIEELKSLHASEMEKQQNLHAKERERQKRLLDNCLREKGVLEEMSKKGVENYMQNILGPVVDENAKLKEEIKTLKTQIEKLKTELKEAKK
jgi:hypothetical protein